MSLLLLLLLSRLSRVRLCAAPETAALQASPSPGFSRQECWSGLSFPSPMHESEKGKGSHSVVPDSGDPMDCRLPGPSIHGIFQARVLEWGAIAFSIGRGKNGPSGLLLLLENDPLKTYHKQFNFSLENLILYFSLALSIK